MYNAFTDVPANNDTAFKEEIMTKTISFPVINLKSTGSNIESCRREAGLSVRDLQDYFGFEYPQAIYKWQHGECLPTVDNLLALSRILEVKMEDLLVYEDQEVSFLETGDGSSGDRREQGTVLCLLLLCQGCVRGTVLLTTFATKVVKRTVPLTHP